jgi:hypothetical protein
MGVRADPPAIQNHQGWWEKIPAGIEKKLSLHLLPKKRKKKTAG